MGVAVLVPLLLSVMSLVLPPGAECAARRSLRRTKWEGYEHETAGASVGSVPVIDVEKSKQTNSWTWKNTPVSTKFPNAARAPVALDETVPMAGDFFGSLGVDTTICQEAGDGHSRFDQAFRSFWNENNARQRSLLREKEGFLDEIRAEFQKEKNAIATAGGKKPSEAIKALGNFRWFGIRNMIDLAVVNFDHFGACAVKAYTKGHTSALATAKQAHGMMASFNAGQVDAVANLVLEALFKEFFALHFLTDLFSAGHIRTPRWDMFQVCRQCLDDQGKPKCGEQSIGMRAMSMHDEDSRVGLNVVDKTGKSWKAFGDAFYFNGENSQNRRQAELAVKTSVQEIVAAFKEGKDGALKALDLIPDLEKVNSDPAITQKNICPLFKSMAGGILIRVDPDTNKPPNPPPGTAQNSPETNFLKMAADAIANFDLRATLSKFMGDKCTYKTMKPCDCCS